MGIKLLPPDVNESDADFTVSGENIRFGLVAIKGHRLGLSSKSSRPNARAAGRSARSTSSAAGWCRAI